MNDFWIASVFVTVLVTLARIAWLFWNRSSRRCTWCRYEKAVRANGDKIRVMGEHHTCWRGVR